MGPQPGRGHMSEAGLMVEINLMGANLLLGVNP